MRRQIVLFMLMVPPHSLHAQWRLSLLTGTASVAGHARDDSDPDHPELRPDRPSSITLGVARDAGAWRMQMTVEHTAADLAEAGGSTAVITRGALRAWGSSAELARRVAGRDGTATLHAAIGAAVNRWEFVDIVGAARWRAAGRAALEADLPFGVRWSAVVRGEFAVEPSVFNDDELPSDFSKRTGVQTGLLVGVARRW